MGGASPPYGALWGPIGPMGGAPPHMGPLVPYTCFGAVQVQVQLPLPSAMGGLWGGSVRVWEAPCALLGPYGAP